jgi:Short C-terminal domain
MLPIVLAQSANTKASQGEVILWVAILILVAFLGGMVILWIRKKMLAKENPADAGSLLDHLRAMLQRGEITQEEFDATKKAMVKRLTTPRASAPAHPDAKQPPHTPRGRDRSA